MSDDEFEATPRHAFRYEPDGAREVFRERLNEPGYRHLRNPYPEIRHRGSVALVEDLARMFRGYGFEAGMREDFSPPSEAWYFGDGRNRLLLIVRLDGTIDAEADMGIDDRSLNISAWIEANLTWDADLGRWVGPVIKVPYVVGHEREMQVVRDFTRPGAPARRLDALETLSELVFGGLREVASLQEMMGRYGRRDADR